MAIIKIDPNQTRTVIALLAVLVVALAVTVIRVRPAPPAAPQAEPVERKATAQAPAEPPDWSFRPVRNPFVKPPLSAPQEDSPDAPSIAAVAMDPLPHRPQEDLWRQPENNWLGPFPLGAFGAAQPGPSSAGPAPRSPEDQPARPDFVLLATVRDSHGLSAVIRQGPSDVRVVEVGDTLDGGFKVKHLEEDRAILTDGREIAIAKRPPS